MAFGKTTPTLGRIDARLSALRQRLTAAKRNAAKAKTAKGKSAALKRQRRIEAAIRALLAVRTRVQKAKVKRVTAPVKVTPSEDAAIDAGTEEDAAESEDEPSEGSEDMGRPDPRTIADRIASARNVIAVHTRAIAGIEAKIRQEVAAKKLFWAARVATLRAARDDHRSKLDWGTRLLSRLLQQQRAVAPPSPPPRELTRAATKFVAAERPAIPYRPKGSTVTPVSRTWLSVPDIYRHVDITPTVAARVERHYAGLLLKYRGRLAPEDLRRFEERRVVAYKQGHAFFSQRAIEVQKVALAEQKARFARARQQRNYAESTRINTAIQQLEARIRAAEMQARADGGPAESGISTFSPTAPAQYVAAKIGQGGSLPAAAAEQDEATREPSDPGAEGEGADDSETEETPWYMRPLVIVGAIAAAAVAVMVAKGKKGKKEHAHGEHAPHKSSHS